MFLLLPIIIALAADPTPAASSAARPTPLTEIGRVRALPACVPIVAHANGAITEALENDRTFSVITHQLARRPISTSSTSSSAATPSSACCGRSKRSRKPPRPATRK